VATEKQSLVWQHKDTGSFLMFGLNGKWPEEGDEVDSPNIDKAYVGNKVPFLIRRYGVYLPVPVLVTKSVEILKPVGEENGKDIPWG